MRASNKGEAATILLIILGLVGLSQVVPNFRPSNWFKKGPPTAELVAAQKKADEADKKAADAQAQLEKLEAANAAKKDSQITYSHQMVQGAIEANSHAPESTEKAIVDAFLQRADIGLNTAIGKLDPALRSEVISLVAQLRSGDLEKIKAANAMLAEKDKQLTQSALDRLALQSEISTVRTERDVALNEKAATKEVVAKVQGQVIAYADKAHEQEKEAGSLGALVTKIGWILAIVIGIIIFCNWILPSLAAEFPSLSWLVALNKTTKSLTSAHA